MRTKTSKSANLIVPDKFPRYPMFKWVLEKINRIYSMIMRKRLPPGVVFKGITGVGKSSALNILLTRNPVQDTPKGIESLILRIETPSPVTSKGIILDLLYLMGDPTVGKDTTNTITKI